MDIARNKEQETKHPLSYDTLRSTLYRYSVPIPAVLARLACGLRRQQPRPGSREARTSRTVLYSPRLTWSTWHTGPCGRHRQWSEDERQDEDRGCQSDPLLGQETTLLFCLTPVGKRNVFPGYCPAKHKLCFHGEGADKARP